MAVILDWGFRFYKGQLTKAWHCLTYFFFFFFNLSHTKCLWRNYVQHPHNFALHFVTAKEIVLKGVAFSGFMVRQYFLFDLELFFFTDII